MIYAGLGFDDSRVKAAVQWIRKRYSLPENPQLVTRQKENGSWLNSKRRWMEGDPNLVTAYALLTLVYCRPSPQK